MERLGCARIPFGVLFAGAGVWIVVGAIVFPETVAFANESGDRMPRLVNIVCGFAFLAPGLWALGAHKLFAPQWTDAQATRFWMTAVALTVACVIFAAVLGDPNDASFPQGRWAAVVAGAVFLMGGAAVMATGSSRPWIRERLGGVLALIIITLFGVLFTGLALTGAEPDAAELRIFGFSFVPPAWLDNILLFFVAILLDAISVVAWYRLARKGS
jgi:hypothetical protein